MFQKVFGLAVVSVMAIAGLASAAQAQPFGFGSIGKPSAEKVREKTSKNLVEVLQYKKMSPEIIAEAQKEFETVPLEAFEGFLNEAKKVCAAAEQKGTPAIKVIDEFNEIIFGAFDELGRQKGISPKSVPGQVLESFATAINTASFGEACLITPQRTVQVRRI
jgi:hypothetical protein